MKQNFNKLYCTNRYNKGKIHISYKDSCNDSSLGFRRILCKKESKTVYVKLSKIFIVAYPNQKYPIINYEKLCKNCINRLSKENQEILKQNAIVAKLKS